MATLALVVLGTYLGAQIGGSAAIIAGVTSGMIGGALGASVGGIIDSQFLMPAIFSGGGSNTTMFGPRIDDYQLQTGSEGAPVRVFLGPENRVSGNMIWASPIKETKHVTETEVSGGKGGGGGSSKQKTVSYTYSRSFAIAFGQGPVKRIVKMWADSKLIYSKNDDDVDSRCDSITTYLGTENQYSFMDGHPAYRGTVYAYFDNMQLADFGQRVPTITALIEQDDEIRIGEAIQKLCGMAGISSSNVDVSKVRGCFRGYNWAGPQKIQNLLLPIMNAYSLRAQESDGILKFFPRGSEPTRFVPEEDLGATVGGDSSSAKLQITEAGDNSLPTAIAISYIDPDKDYQKGSQIERRTNDLNPATFSFDCPFVVSADEARVIARRQLWTAWGETRNVEFALPPSYLNTQEGDVLKVEYKGKIYSIRVLESERGANFLMTVKGVIQEDDVATQVAEKPESNYTPIVPYQPPEMLMEVLDLPAIQTEDVDSPAVYIAACCRWPLDVFKGAVLSTGSGDTLSSYAAFAQVPLESTMGVTTTVLPWRPRHIQWDGWDKPNIEYWDMLSKVTVTMYDGELVSRPIQDVLSGANVLLIGDELVSFLNAELIDTATYRISGLLRGRRGTHDAMKTHVVGERVVYVNPNWLVRRAVPTSMIGTSRKFVVTPAGKDFSDEDAVDITFEAKSRVCMPVCGVTGKWNADGSYTIKWQPRSRDFVRIFGAKEKTDPDDYELVFFNNDISYWESDLPDDVYLNQDPYGYYIVSPFTKSVENARQLTLTSAEVDQLLSYGPNRGSFYFTVFIYQLNENGERGLYTRKNLK